MPASYFKLPFLLRSLSIPVALFTAVFEYLLSTAVFTVIFAQYENDIHISDLGLLFNLAS